MSSIHEVRSMRRDQLAGAQVWMSVFGGLLVFLSIPLLVGGVWHAATGGSWLYTLTGIAFAASGLMALRGQVLGLWLYLLAFVGLLVWGISVAGTDILRLFYRLSGPTALAVAATVLIVSRRRAPGQRANLVSSGDRTQDDP